MHLSGQIKTACPPDFLLKVMHDPQAMGQLLPAGSKLDGTGDGAFSFTMIRSVGPLRLTLPGTMTLAPKGNGPNQTLTIKAAHLIGGKVDVTLNIDLSTAQDQTRIGYDGEIAATGLAGRVLKEHRARANSVVKAALARLKFYAEAQFKQQTAV